MKTAAWNYDDLWLGSAFSNRVFNTTHIVMLGWFINPTNTSVGLITMVYGIPSSNLT